MAKVVFAVADTFAARRDLAALDHAFMAEDGLLRVEFEDVAEDEAMFLMIKASTSHGFRAKELPGSQKAKPLIAPHLVAHHAPAPHSDREDTRVARKDDSESAAPVAREKKSESPTKKGA